MRIYTRQEQRRILLTIPTDATAGVCPECGDKLRLDDLYYDAPTRLPFGSCPSFALLLLCGSWYGKCCDQAVSWERDGSRPLVGIDELYTMAELEGA